MLSYICCCLHLYPAKALLLRFKILTLQVVGLTFQVFLRQQLGEVSDVLDQADPALADAFTRLDCSELFFAYRMLLVLMSRELRLSEVYTYACLCQSPSFQSIPD